MSCNHTADSAGQPVSPSGCSRRNFLVSVAGGLSIGFFLPDGGRMLEAATAPATEAQLNAWVRIGTDGKITLLFGGCEMGQGSMSGLSQILAEELMVDWNQLTIRPADADAKISYTTGGSSAVSRRYLPLRTAAATARELLVAAAMLTTGDTARGNYSAKSGVITRKDPVTGALQSWNYGSLALQAATPQAQALLPAVIPLTPPDQFRLIGKPLARPDIPPKTNGSALYGIDVFLPGMVFAVIKHCPTIGGTLALTPATPSGAIAVVPCFTPADRGAIAKNSFNAVAVVADNTWKAKKIAQGLKVQWALPASTASVDSASLVTLAKQLLETGQPIVAEPASAAPDPATLKTVLGSSAKSLEATFTVPHLAHATMEVLNCSVRPTHTAGVLTGLEIWAPTQSAMSVVATANVVAPSLTPAQITVHTTFLGGGLGRKIEQDYISQAVQIAVAVGRPVKLTWMREEDFGHDQYRPMAVIRVRAGLNATGGITAWWYRNVSPSILQQRGRAGLDSQAIEGSVRLPYTRAMSLTEWVPLPSGIPVGFWRSVGASINAFAVESMIDMLAIAAGRDPFVFRASLVSDPRYLDLLAAADAASSWRKTLPSNRAWGMAVAESFGTLVCEVIEISAPTAGAVVIHRVAAVVDCGTVINPDSVEAQIQGAIIHGLTAALWGEMKFVNGVASQGNFNRYRMMRLNETPTITVKVMTSANPPTGIGEPGVPPSAPALANAYSRLKKTRVTSLPLFPGTSMSGL
ncbi:MAG: xanthine dehydrogenase family protein molybdopterin-binding subunit [Verrucomicrobiales bacterium]|nr:xanthine dehydrogenase family protein molybdopterin-binding subunit [Verrucomicrobiales bacterium]